MHSQKLNETPPIPWLEKKCGIVLSAHYTHGSGEACSHVGNILHYLEAVTKKDERCNNLHRCQGILVILPSSGVQGSVQYRIFCSTNTIKKMDCSVLNLSQHCYL